MADSSSPLPCADALRASLNEGDVHVWYCTMNECSSPAQLQTYARLLTVQDQDRHNAYRFADSKQEFLITRALCRHTLGVYLQRRPEDMSFLVNDYGRPELADLQQHGLRFNLANCRSLIACIVAHDSEVGIDVEACDGQKDIQQIAKQFFSNEEASAMMRLPAAERHARFYQYWTLKEAYIKARGMGLSMPLDAFTFRSLCERIQIHFAPPSSEQSVEWQFASSIPQADHRMAIAIHKGPGMDRQIQIRRVQPECLPSVK